MKLLFLFLIGIPAFALVEDGGFHPEPCPTQLNTQVVQSVSLMNNDQRLLDRNIESISDGFE